MRKSMSSALAALAALLPAALVPATAHAESGTASATISVSAAVSPTCQIAATGLNFGSVSQAQADASATVSVTCINGVPYTVSLDKGAGPNATTERRLLKAKDANGDHTLAYTIYRDSTRTQVWGDTDGTKATGIGTGQLFNLTAYGRLFASTEGVVGLAYADAVNVTLTY